MLLDTTIGDTVEPSNATAVSMDAQLAVCLMLEGGQGIPEARRLIEQIIAHSANPHDFAATVERQSGDMHRNPLLRIVERELVGR